jgi:hypothetical protein
MTDIRKFQSALTALQRRAFLALTTPDKIQGFLDRIKYREEDTYRCPLTTMKTGKGCCFEGALLGAAALARLGHPPLIVTLFARDDDDHVLAIYKKNGCFGCVAKSIYPCLRSRQPVYRTLRELVMSYFEFYYNKKGRRTLQSFSQRPLNLDKFDKKNWLEKDETIKLINDALDRSEKSGIVSWSAASRMPGVDRWTLVSTRASKPH